MPKTLFVDSSGISSLSSSSPFVKTSTPRPPFVFVAGGRRGSTIGALIIRIGFWGCYRSLIKPVFAGVTRNPQNSTKAPIYILYVTQRKLHKAVPEVFEAFGTTQGACSSDLQAFWSLQA